MIDKKALLVLVGIMLCLLAQAQRSTYWFFGDRAGIKFTSSGPVDQPGGALNTQEGCATISDTAGNLLFYTDGSTVYNRNHAVMSNGTGLLGNFSSSQSSIIVPMPGSDSLYYIFTVAVPSVTARYHYNIVDMSLQGGLGEVIQKNVQLSTDICSERITAVQHRNRRHFWIVTNPSGTNVFKSYLLTDAGIQPVPAVSTIGFVQSSGYGMLKGSPDGQMLVQTASYSLSSPPPSSPSTQLFRFDPASGYVSNPVALYSPLSTYGCSFSPNSQKLYVTSGFPNPSIGGPFAQFNVSSYNETDIRNSYYPFNVNTPGGWGDISLGPDSVLYVVRCLEKKLSAIQNPNADGPACTFIDNAVPLTGKGIFGLPNFYNNINNPPFYIDVEQQGCLEFRFSFHTNYQGTGTYYWDFGDGHFSSLDSPVHSFVRNNNDSFLVSFYFTSTDQTVKTNLQQWLVLPKEPQAVFTASSNGCVGNNITFTNSSTGNGALTYYWNFGDNTTAAEQVPIKRFTDSGTYIIRLAVTDSLGCVSDTAATTVAVNKKAIAAFNVSGPYCTGSSMAITDASAAWNSTITEWLSDPGTGFFATANAPLPAVSIAAPGNYGLRLVVVSAEGCISDTAKKQLTVFEKPVAGFIMPKNCVTDLSSFTDTSTAGTSVIASWQWNFDDPASAANTSIVQHANHQYNDARNYNVQLIVTTNNGCADTAVQVFTVNGASPKAAMAFGQDPACSGDAVTLINNSTVNFGQLTGLQVNWGTSVTVDNTPASGKQYTHQYLVFGNPSTLVQPVRFTVQSGASCISTLDTFITLKAHPQLQWQSIAPLCAGAPPVLLNNGSITNNAQGSAKYTGTGVSLDASGNYVFTSANVAGNTASVEYSVTTPGGCTADTVQNVVILPKPIVTAGLPQSVVSGQTLRLNGNASGTGVSFQWLPPVWLDSIHSPTPLATPLTNISYTLVATTTDGCVDSSSVSINVLQAVKVPNAFSPNGDGINDRWEIENLNGYNGNVVQVFDRWGRMVFESYGYRQPWSGNEKNNMPLPVGVYYYVINIPGDSRPLTGWVSLLR
jgi:gliding motility-associated-like protein